MDRNFLRKGRRGSGWSLIELTIILICLSILCAILAPVIGIYVRNAKMCRIREDIQCLGCAIWMFVEDTGNTHFLQNGSPGPSLGASRSDGVWVNGSAPDLHASNRVNLLVTDGDIPEVGPDGNTTWASPVNFGEVDFMAYHLITNTPGNDPNRRYRSPLDLNKGAGAYNSDPMFALQSSGGFNSEFAWRGPYMTAPLDPDPWNNRYACNVVYLDPCADSGNATVASQGVNGWTYDCVVLCAGADGEIDTGYDVDGLTPGDDDLIYCISGNSRP